MALLEKIITLKSDGEIGIPVADSCRFEDALQFAQFLNVES